MFEHEQHGGISDGTQNHETAQIHDTALRSYLRRKFPDLNNHDDIVQDCYLRLLKNPGSDHIRFPKAYLFTTARNIVFSQFRRTQRIRFERLAEDPHSRVLASSEHVENTVCHHEEMEILLSAIASLPKRCRQVMTLRFLYDYSHKAIAEELQISAHTVKAQLARGMEKVTARLIRQGVITPRPGRS